jgi:cytidyltransferase-like protein
MGPKMMKKIDNINHLTYYLKFVYMMSLVQGTFLTKDELDTLNNLWEYRVIDKSILSKCFNPLYESCVKIVPKNVSPNVLSFVGLLFSIYAWSISTLGNAIYHNTISAFCIIMYMILDAIDGKQARKTHTVSSLGELVNHFCDCITNAFLTATICNVYEITDTQKIWLMILSTQIAFLLEHVKAFVDPQKTLQFGKFTGPTEALTLIIIMIAFRSKIATYVELYQHIQFYTPYMICAFGLISTITILKCIYKHYLRVNDYSTLFGTVFCFVVQLIKFSTMNLGDGIQNGILFSILCADIILGKMANRCLHQLIPVMHAITCLLPILNVPLACFYFIVNVIDIKKDAKIPCINQVVNVFVSDYYDGFHMGHLMSLIKASKMGTCLIVGVHSQENLMKTMGKIPLKSNQERIRAVTECKYVDKVIPNCPLAITKDFIAKNKIHIVGMSGEYAKYDANGRLISVYPDYQIPFEMGIIKIILKTEEISTSNIRVGSNQELELLTQINAKITALFQSRFGEQVVVGIDPIRLNTNSEIDYLKKVNDTMFVKKTE